ncbi:MAG: TIGR04211 family SH3 domain-containing protein [Bacteroidales bacterium]|nr:TIGR04211 family SH3 domain-containing protein [Bacteroidales bacterium]
MRTFTRQFLYLFIFMFLFSAQAFAVDRYISDILVVTLRDDPSIKSNVIGHMRSGDYMTVLEELDSGYIQVRLSSGIEGWVPKKYTTIGKSKDRLINDLKKNIMAREEETKIYKMKNAELESQVHSAQASIDTSVVSEAKLQASVVDLEKLVAEAQNKYITLQNQSKGVEAIYTERDTLLQDNETLAKKVTVLKLNNQELDQSKNIFWFLSGSGVLLIGWLIGRTGRKSRRNSITL